VVRVFQHGALMAEIIPELWLISRHETALHGNIRRMHSTDLPSSRVIFADDRGVRAAYSSGHFPV
jgi:hypothetical protein